MQLEFWGAAGEVTGSMHLLQVGRHRLLVDCGLVQGRRKQAFERNRNLPFDPASIDAVIEPAQSRVQITRALRALRNKRADRPPRKHGNIPL